MPHYRTLGKIPRKRHTQFRNEKGGLYAEELVGTQGFSGMASLVYHIHPPTMVVDQGEPWCVEPKVAVEKNLKCRNLNGFAVPPVDDFLESRKTVFVNHELHIGLAAPRHSMMDYFFKNADADEMIFVHKGTGTLHTTYGKIPFEYGDYLIIPRGTIYQIQFDTEENRLYYVESFSPIVSPKRYRNYFGQMLEHSPFCERDYKVPTELETFDEEGEFKVLIKKQGMIHPFTYGTHPFDVVGWDGYHYPYAISIFDFEPITGRVHQPPPVHQQFEGGGFVVCSFVPRKYDYHPDAIPAPYNHSNIDSDEILYYVDGDFMSRNNIDVGQITLHPGGIPHGPHPGAVERSIGKESTEEMAVMIDPFRPMMLTEQAMEIEVPGYHKSWHDHG